MGLSRSGMSGALPFSLPGGPPVAWYSPQLINGLADGAALYKLPDASGNGRDCYTSVSAGTQGSLETNEVNGLSVARLDGTKGGWGAGAGTTAAMWRFLHSSSFTYVGLVKATFAAAGSGHVWDTNGGSTGANIGSELFISDSPTAAQIKCRIGRQAGGAGFVADASSSAGAFPLNAWHIIVARYQLAHTSSDLLVEVDGTSVATSESTGVPDVSNDPTGPLNIGSRTSTGADKFTGDLGDQIFFSRRLTDAEVTTLVGSLRSSYGI